MFFLWCVLVLSNGAIAASLLMYLVGSWAPPLPCCCPPAWHIGKQTKQFLIGIYIIVFWCNQPQILPFLFLPLVCALSKEKLLTCYFADIYSFVAQNWHLGQKIFKHNFNQTKSERIVSKLIKCRYIVRSSLGCQCGWQPQWLSEGRILSKVFAQKKIPQSCTVMR